MPLVPTTSSRSDTPSNLITPTDDEALFFAQTLGDYRTVTKADKDALFGQFLHHAEKPPSKEDAPHWKASPKKPCGAGVKEAIASAGAKVLYLLPYSPDLNPIERVFAKLQTWVRQAKLMADTLYPGGQII